MIAAVLAEPQDISERPLRIEEVPRPALEPGHVLLKVRACGVCRTDLHIVEGELPLRREHLIPGHQIVGDVVEGVPADLAAGTRVGVSWIGGTDGTCWYCRRGMENLCVINKTRAHDLIQKFSRPEQVAAAMKGLSDHWSTLLSNYAIESSDEKLNRTVNIWNPYQCMVTFNMSRSASYFETGIGRGM